MTPEELTHASFFSGVGGLDLGLERAGWTTVSFSEIDAYASAVLASRWPGVPNLGSIVDLARDPGERGPSRALVSEGRRLGQPDRGDWTRAFLWTGGFPCQDLSVAGKRRGMGTHTDRLDTRSGLAYAFLDLVERHRPPAVLLENVPGLLSSHAGKDLGALLGRLGELGYGWAYRVLDAQHFGVPQRRRRVFILALRRGGHPDADGAAEVLAVGARCGRDHAAEREAWARAAGRAGRGPVGTFTAGAHPGSYNGQDAYTGHLVPVVAPTLRGFGHGWQGQHNSQPELLVSPSPDPRGDGAADGLAGRLDDRAGVAWAKRKRAASEDDDETWGRADVTPTLNGFGVGDARAVTLVADTLLSSPDGGTRTTDLNQTHVIDAVLGPADPLLPLGLDSHRYRCCGNGVVAPVAEWIGARLAAWALAVAQEDAA